MSRLPPKYTLKTGDFAYYDCRNMGMIKCKVVAVNEKEILAKVTIRAHGPWVRGDTIICDNQGGASWIVPREAVRRINPITKTASLIENFKVEVDNA